MEFYTEPRVELLALTQVARPWVQEEWQPDWKNEDAANLIEFAGRQCYRSFDNPSGRTNAAYIANLLTQNHLSVVDHASAAFRMRQISRSCSHELVRHRHLSFSQLSQRYVAGEPSFVVPPALRGRKEAERFFVWACEAAARGYAGLLNDMNLAYGEMPATGERHKLAREAARSLLPNATATELVVSGNFTAWRWFLKMRCGRAADWEMRQVAMAVLGVLQAECPAVFGDFGIGEDERGPFAESVYPR